MNARQLTILVSFAVSFGVVRGGTLEEGFKNPPDSARPGVYWYFMDGNLDREEMVKDLESMKEVGLGNLVSLEVYVGVPRGPVKFMSDLWQELFVNAVRHAERLGIDMTLGAGPGWTGSGPQDWTTSEQRGIKYYSGIATDRKTFELPKGTGKRLYLDLGTVHDIAQVNLNGKDLGVVWCAPWRIEITEAVKNKGNVLAIDVGESGLLSGREYKTGRYTFATAGGPNKLLPSGLMGPVRITVQVK